MSIVKPFWTYGKDEAIANMLLQNVGKHETTVWSYAESLETSKNISFTYYYSTFF